MRAIATSCRAALPAILGLAALLALSAPAPAQLTEAQAVKQFKSAAKPILKQQKAALAEVEASFEATLGLLEAAIEAGNFDKPQLELLLPDVIALQVQAREITTAAEGEAVTALAAILLDLAGAGTGDGSFPLTFYANAGGVWDDFRSSLGENLAKAWAKLDKRARKVVKAATKSGFALTLRIDPPAILQDGAHTFNEGAAVVAGFGPITADVFIGGSSLAVEGDGVLLLAGTYNQSDVTDVSIRLFHVLDVGSEEFLATTPTLSDPLGSWGVVMDGGDGLPEGNYVVQVSQPGDDSCPEAVEGVVTTAGVP